METNTSLAAGAGGKPLETERLSLLPPLPRTGAGETGQTFAREVERAVERARGEGERAKRLDELVGERRAARRASFGAERGLERGPEPEGTQASEAVFRPEHAPVAAQAAPAPRAPAELALPASSTPEPPAEAQEATAPAPHAAAVSQAPGAGPASSAAATTVRPAAAEALAALGRSSAEAAPLEAPPVTRAGSERGAKPVLTPGAAQGPDAALLERSEEILRQIRLHAAPGVQRLTLELEPSDLGRLSIQLALRTGKVTAIVRAESADTLERLERQKDELLAVLSERGIQADSVRFEHGFGAARAAPARPSAVRAAEPPPQQAAAVGAFRSLLSPRGPAPQLDTYA